MEKMIEVNCETGEVIERELTEDEVVQRKIDAENEIALTELKTQLQAAKQAAQAKLEALGLTIDDLKALGL